MTLCTSRHHFGNFILCVHACAKANQEASWGNYNVVVAYNVHLIAALDFCVCKPKENGKNENSVSVT